MRVALTRKEICTSYFQKVCSSFNMNESCLYKQILFFLRSLFVLPQINVDVELNSTQLEPQQFQKIPVKSTIGRLMLSFEVVNPVMMICLLILCAGLYKFATIVNAFIKQLRNKNDLYSFVLTGLKVPGQRKFPYKLIKMAVDETDTLICAHNNGTLYVWDLFHGSCTHHIDRK